MLQNLDGADTIAECWLSGGFIGLSSGTVCRVAAVLIILSRQQTSAT